MASLGSMWRNVMLMFIEPPETCEPRAGDYLATLPRETSSETLANDGFATRKPARAPAQSGKQYGLELGRPAHFSPWGWDLDSRSASGRPAARTVACVSRKRGCRASRGTSLRCGARS